MPRFRIQEWIWLGLMAVAILVMIGVIVAPWL